MDANRDSKKVAAPNVPSEEDLLSELPTTGPEFQGRQTVAGRYEILSRLGRGGMGEVWHAYDLKLRVDVALKSLRLDLKRNQDPVEALRREVRTAREVISPNVCRIFDLVVEEDQELISMEYIDGITLTAMLVKKGALELREARDIAAQFLAGLEAIHQAGLVHRDLKPENIMITRTGRVVVMDFGIAKQVTQLGGTISGTLPYMSPEQLSGQKVDARSDVFSAGIVLAEMIHPQGVFSQKTREEIWSAVRKHPMQLPESPWKAVIVRAVAEEPGNRFPSAGALARALEEVTQRVETIEERKPYPGLSSFTAADAEYFFGRELEVETVIKKLQQLHLMALIGPSGAGKTSFLRAGLIPSLPAGWSHVFCTPGDAPLVNLGQSLVPELSGDMEAMRKMVRLEDTDTALWLLHRWSENHPEAVLIVDRFEELFTLNNPQTQSRFAELLGRAALEADVRVLLAMRDDFLMLCHDHAALIPIFSELTGLSPLGGAALRRALVQPALRCNYRFEDETLVDEILADVEKERGALPLMAFAASRLWEKRDRQTGQLTREAYKEIGGVVGALAQHAEATMERIGGERQPIVREIFRNLITAQNTRAARDTEELLSVFPEKQTAEEALRALIDARLLTSFEAPQVEGEKPRRRVEIIHESLLTNWPRLVRWQTQDADSAQLRDQLRQAAQLWEQRSRSEDLLWTGAAFLEFQAWRQRYPGGLSSTEEAFAQAMVQRASKRRRQRRIIISAIFVILLGVLGVISAFWRSSETARTKEHEARKEAVSQARRAEASKLLALGRLQLEEEPSTALAYALASLEVADLPEGRRFALETLSKGPTASVIEMPIKPNYVEFSPDGKWLAVGGYGGARLLARDGSKQQILSDRWAPNFKPRYPQFGPDGNYVVWTSAVDQSVIRVWSVSKAAEIRTLKMEGETRCLVRGTRLFLLTGREEEDAANATISGRWRQSAVWTWGFNDQEPELLARWDLEPVWSIDIDKSGKWIAYPKGNRIYIRSVQNSVPERLIGEHTTEARQIKFLPDGTRIASSDASGEIRIWSLEANSKSPLQIMSGNWPVWDLSFNSAGSLLAASHFADNKLFKIWNLNAGPGVEPLRLRGFAESYSTMGAFDPSSRWVAVPLNDVLAFYQLGHPYPLALHQKGDSSGSLVFTADGKSLITSSGRSSSSGQHGSIRLWDLPGDHEDPGRDLWSAALQMNDLDVDPAGKQILIGTLRDGALLLSIAGGTIRRLPGPSFFGWVAFSPDGRLAAGTTTAGAPEDYGIRIWDMETGKVNFLEASSGKLPNVSLGDSVVKFSSDGTLFSGDFHGNLYQWNLKDGTRRIVRKGNGPVNSIALTGDSRYLIASWSSKPRKGFDPDPASESTELILFDLKNGSSRNITSHGNRVNVVGFDQSGKILVTGDLDGAVRVGPIPGEPPHLLLGHRSWIWGVAVHPDGKWIASSETLQPFVHLWPMPQGRPFHTLPYNEFLDRLRSLTNVRVAADTNSSTGYRTEFASFPGWTDAPTW